MTALRDPDLCYVCGCSERRIGGKLYFCSRHLRETRLGIRHTMHPVPLRSEGFGRGGAAIEAAAASQKIAALETRAATAEAALQLAASQVAAYFDKREDAQCAAHSHLEEAARVLAPYVPKGGLDKAAAEMRMALWREDWFAEKDKRLAAAEARLARIAAYVAEETQRKSHFLASRLPDASDRVFARGGLAILDSVREVLRELDAPEEGT